MFRAVVILVMLLLGQTSASADCNVFGLWIPYWGGKSTAEMTVSGGEPCSLPIDAGGTNIIESMVISSQPRNGTTRVSDDTVWYQSRPGFTGQDSFSFTVTGSGGGSSGSSSVRVNVTVQ
jgi:hypothetical protein